MTEPADKIETLRERIYASDEISTADEEVLIAFSDELYLLKSKYGNYRHEKLLRHCIRMAECVGGLAQALEDRETAENIVRWIHREYDNEETNHDYRTALRIFAKRVTDGDELPDSVAWIPSGYRKNYNPKPHPGEMLRWEEDVQPMINATKNSRDAALIAVAWDSGARSGELQDLTIGDISDSRYGLQMTVDGKTGQRSVTLIPSVPYLNRWLDDHPASDNSMAPLWCNLETAEELSYQMFRKVFKQAAERAGVDKPVTPTNFRKSSASHLASRGMNQAAIEDHHGWTRGSDVASRYVSVFSGETDTQLAQIHGKDVDEDQPEPIAPLECPRCGRENPRDRNLCVWCHQALDPEAVETIRERESDVRQVALELVQEDPEAVDKIRRAERLMTLLEDNSQLQEEAIQFAEALEAESG